MINWFLIALLVVCSLVIGYLALQLEERNTYITFLWYQIEELSSGSEEERSQEYLDFLEEQRQSVAKFQATHEPYIHEIE